MSNRNLSVTMRKHSFLKQTVLIYPRVSGQGNGIGPIFLSVRACVSSYIRSPALRTERWRWSVTMATPWQWLLWCCLHRPTCSPEVPTILLACVHLLVCALNASRACSYGLCLSIHHGKRTLGRRDLTTRVVGGASMLRRFHFIHGTLYSVCRLIMCKGY